MCVCVNVYTHIYGFPRICVCVYVCVYVCKNIYTQIHFPGGSVIIHLPMQETWVQSLGWEDPLESEMVTHSNILAWEITWTEESGGLQSRVHRRVRHDCD